MHFMIDRDEIRRILEPIAPPADLDWMVASCPSVELAKTYRAPAPAPERKEWCR